MSIKQNILLSFQNISHSFADKKLFSNLTGSIKKGDRIGLVGINGSGKSTLLKILSSQLSPKEGEIHSIGKVTYLPQLNLELYREEISIYKYIEKNKPDWWTVISKHKELFGKDFDEMQTLSSLSGGELIKLHMALIWSLQPCVVLLDEPTNHLDLESLQSLENLLRQSDIPFIVVSHDIAFLNNVVNSIWEIEKGLLKIYGGNYDFYLEEKENILQSQRDKYEVIRKKVNKEKKALQERTISYQRKTAKLKRMARANDRSMPKIVRNSIKGSVQNSFGTDKIQKEKSIENKFDQMEVLKVAERKKYHLDLGYEKKRGLIVSIENADLIIDNELILIEDFNLKIYHGDRVCIKGNNGSGKTTLIKQLEYAKASRVEGEISYGDKYETLYVDQKYDLVDPRLSLVENIFKNNLRINNENARKALGNLGFNLDANVTRNAETLSGGETARLAFAIATSSAADLLILDEPTNNLDIFTKEIISEAIREYEGTLIIVSHDREFLERIGVENYYLIKDRKLEKILNF